ncbi:MAG: AAA family ATPase [Planctomycetaceae bacterium]
MYSSINISGYRSLSRLTIEPLGRINLLVGENNSGKTSILEAIHLLADGARGSLLDVALRRGECLVAEDNGNGRPYLQDIRQVFSGRER